jgi:site-specific recombinase XerC
LQVLLRTGLRIGELAALDRRDVQVTQRTGQVIVRHGKGDRYRVVPLSRSARHALQAWLVERAEYPRTPTATDPLWLSRTGARLSARTINAIVAKAMLPPACRRRRTPCAIRWPRGWCGTTGATSCSSLT